MRGITLLEDRLAARLGYRYGMATISAASLEQQLVSLLSYEQTGSVADAQTAITVIKQLMILRRSSQSHDSSSHSFDNGTLSAMLDDAKMFVRHRSSAGAVRFLGVQDLRG